MSRRSRLFGVAFLTLAAAGACTEGSVEIGGDLSFTITPDRSAAGVGEEVTFNYDATGAVLIGIIMEYGDGTADTLDTAGAQRANGRFLHSFYAPGTFTVVGTLQDNLLGPASDQATVEVSGGA